MTDVVPGGVRAAYEALGQAVADAASAFGAQPDRASAGAALGSLAGALEANRAALDSELFPAMFESMAGSDAVCIRDMQRNLSDTQRELTRHLVHLAARPDVDARHQEQLLSGCARYLAYEREEVLAMAERILVGA